jgi:enediyne biosynthesis protein E4
MSQLNADERSRSALICDPLRHLRIFSFFVSSVSLWFIAFGCRPAVETGIPAQHAAGSTQHGPGSAPLFRDRAAAAGIAFRLGHGGKSPLDIRETIGAGCAFLDFDRDGWLDVLLIGQTGTASGGRCALYRNRGDGAFVDVTAGSGLEEPGFWTGCATGDWDNDGWVDLVITGDGRTRLLRNETVRAGDGATGRNDGTVSSRPVALSPRRPVALFRDVTATSGVRVPGWATSVQLADVDGDGRLDLYVARYVRFGPHDPRFCQVGIAPGTGQPVQGACGPEVYDPEVGLFFHNEGGGRFREATRAAGLADAHGRGLGVAFADLNADGRPELYVANDRMPGDLFENRGGRFENVGVASGTAYGGGGNIQGGMGVDVADVDQDGRPDLFVTTFYREPKSLYRNLGGLLFEEIGERAGIGLAAMDSVGFGTKFFDLENDGRLDLVFVNGHVVETAERVDRAATYRQPSLLYRGRPDGTFREATAEGGPDLQRPIVGRGLAAGDFDNDGLPDLLAVDLEGAPLLLHNEGVGGRAEGPPPGRSASRGHWLGLQLVTARGAPALGARVTVRAGGRSWKREVTTGGSYLSASDPRLLFGLETVTHVDAVEVAWPSGARRTLRDPAVDRYIELRDPGA